MENVFAQNKSLVVALERERENSTKYIHYELALTEEN
jgi:hypothetical protein